MNVIKYKLLNAKYKVLNAIIVMGYEIKLNPKYDRYPDFYLVGRSKTLRIEVEDKTPETLIAKSISAISKIDTTEFWFVVKKKDMRKIRENLRENISNKIKLYSMDDVGEELNKFFN
jgi:hypothetical protein